MPAPYPQPFQPIEHARPGDEQYWPTSQEIEEIAETTWGMWTIAAWALGGGLVAFGLVMIFG